MGTKLISPCISCDVPKTENINKIFMCHSCDKIKEFRDKMKERGFGVDSGDRIEIYIPAGHIAKIEDDTVIFEPENPKFKEGDFLKIITRSNTWLVILSRTDSKRRFIPYCAFAPSDEYLSIGNNVRFLEPDENRVSKMTDSEKQILLDKLHESGKDWDSEKCEIVDWVWKPKIGEKYWALNNVGRMVWYLYTNTDVEKAWVRNGLIFRTHELAESALELLKQAKHY